jgi:hypothetical protein
MPSVPEVPSAPQMPSVPEVGAGHRVRSVLRIGIGTGVVVLGLLISHWTATSDPRPGPAQAAAVPVSRQVGADVAGNGRPVVIRYSGHMVRRCEAVGLYARNPSGQAQLRRELHAAARTLGLTVTDLAADVLSPATLERAAPDVVACLPEGAGPSVAHRLLAARLVGADHSTAESVLVHAVTFTVRPVHTTAISLAAAVDREGILSDTLGRYDVDRSSTARLVIRYIGPLVSDSEIDGVRAAIARRAGTSSAAVRVTALSTAWPAIDPATEPPPAPATQTAPPPQHHH